MSGGFWLFANQALAEAAQKVLFKLLPKDTLADGAVAPVQVTTRWSDLVALTDGRIAIVGHPTVALKPAIATLVADIAALLPPPASML